jgi:dihydromethanopterin reductase (acceptor)
VRIAWGITGSGHLLLETFETMQDILKMGKHTVSIFLSKAGEEVARMYGILSDLRKMANGPLPFRFVRDFEQGASSPPCGKFNLKAFPVLFVGPATANTVAKIKVGIADTLVTNIVAMSVKGGAPVIVLPSDYIPGPIVTTLPVTVKSPEKSSCQDEAGKSTCNPCKAVEECPTHAISLIEGKPNVDLTKCIGCKRCVKSCKGHVFEFGKKITIHIRQVDADNARALGKLEGIKLIGHPREFEKWLLSQD